MGLGFPALFFCAVVWQLTPNNCSFPAGHGAVNSLAVQLEQLFTQEAVQQVLDLPIPKTPEQLYGTATPIPIPIQEDYALKPNNCPDYAPISTPMTPIPPRLTGKSPNNSPTVCPPCLSNIAILWVLRYFALSPLVLYGY